MDEDALDPAFASRFEPADRGACGLYLISPERIGEDFAEALAAALDAGPVAAFQLRLKGLGDDEVARAAEPLQRVCA
ncbi:MAG: thiamine phosphate synthase, partial [Pseudomonadota bacterium]|nr:thiamine phosphate synthase [Pseudomonadota bacterium]